MFSSKSSSELKSPVGKPDIGPPPPYNQSTASPLVLSETTTTRTEVVTTTTTTETTTHLFSLPHWRKRNGSRPSSSKGISPVTDSVAFPVASPSRSFHVNKALPPTPSPTIEIREDAHISPVGSPQRPHLSDVPPPLPAGLDTSLPRGRKSSSTSQSATILAHAALGIGFPHASAALSPPPPSTKNFSPPSGPLSPVPPSSPSQHTHSKIRRVKSSHKVVPSNDKVVDHDQLRERRKRGLSFGATSFLNAGTSDMNAKAQSAEETISLPQKPVSRKSSFWGRRKSTHSVDPTGLEPKPLDSPLPPDEAVFSLPPLPPVQVSPFGISEFPMRSSLEQQPDTPVAIARSRSEHRSKRRPPELTPSPRPNISHLLDKVIQTSADPQPLPRLRTQTGSPLLHRLSLGVFSSPEPLRGSPSSATVNLSSTPTSPSVAVRRPEVVIPKPLVEAESPEVFLSRLKSEVSKAEVAGILASSVEPFYAQALRAYIGQFTFKDIPLDVALRKLLMEVGLPRETQQIDRVMEAFAARYMESNENLFISEDHPYILAFSLIMLHTDVFNPSNKRKMSKADYIKNTKLPGIPVEILDCYFDNIVFAPFIFIEDPVDFNGQPGISPDFTLSTTTPTFPSAGTSSAFKIGNKVDPYYLITNNLLHSLKVDVNAFIPLESPYTYEGTNGGWDEQLLHRAFITANIIEVDMPPLQSVFSLSPSGVPGPISSYDLSPVTRTWNLKITKVGMLNRKDDLVEGGKKAMNRKWKQWSVVLTGSQLLFCRDPSWSTRLNPSSPSQASPISSTVAPIFRPDELFSVKDSIAVYDRSYTKYQHTFRLVLPDGRQFLLQCEDNTDLNEWISRINYASTFKTTGVRIRPAELSGEDVALTGVAAATSHLHDIQERVKLQRHRSWGSNAPNELMDMLTGGPSSTGHVQTPLRRRVTLAHGATEFDLEAPVSPEVDGAEQFKATFDRVKADLAESPWISADGGETWLLDPEAPVYDSPPASPTSFNSTTSRLPSRSRIVRTKIKELESKLATLRSQLETDERLVRNISILTPFQKSTRTRLCTVLQGMTKRIMQVRLDVEKLKCHRAVLRADIVAEGRCWYHSKREALRVAKDTLQGRHAQQPPAMTISVFDDYDKSFSSEELPQMLRVQTSPGPPSSTCGSFHSAVEGAFEMDDPRSSTSTPGSTFNRDPSSFFLSSKHDLSSTSHSSLSSPQISGDQPQFLEQSEDAIDIEQATEWNRTRAAQRVSLIHIPSDIAISAKLKRVVEASMDETS